MSNHYVSDVPTRGHYEQLDHSLLFTPENPQPVTATALRGGAEDGQSFQVAIEGRSSEDVVHKAVSVAQPRVSVPVGAWRDGMCDCFLVGCCHPAFWNAWCFPAILVAQVMTRMKLDVLGRPSRQRPPSTFRVVLGIVVTFMFLVIVVKPILFDLTHTKFLMIDPEITVMVPKAGMEGWANFFDIFFILLQISFSWFIVYLATVTRAYVRNKYAIPNACCNIICTRNGCGVEDCCVSYWCMCCTAGQLARHTMDYHTYRGVCCSDTGVPNYVPSIV